MEGLLPSEIARLVLGYLQGESCEEVAKCFLEKSPHLAECLKLSRMGRKFTTKVSGYSLTDILEEFCSVYSIVQEQLSSLPPGNEHLKHGSLADQLKHLFKALCPVQVKITLNSQQNGQNTSNGDAGSEVVTSTPRVRNSRKSISRFQNTLDQNDSCPDPSPAALPPPDATPLESLPGNSDHAVVQNTDCLGSGASNFNQEPKNTPSTANFNEVGTYVDNTTANPKEYNAVGDKQSLPYAAPSAPPVSDTSNQDARTMTAPPPSSAMYTLHEQNVSFTSSFIPGPGLDVDSSRQFVYVPSLSGISPSSAAGSISNEFVNTANWKSAAPDSKLPCVITDHCNSKIVLVGIENMSEHPLSIFHHIPPFEVTSIPRNELAEQVGRDIRKAADFVTSSE